MKRGNGDTLTAQTDYAVDELLLVVWSYWFFPPKFKTIKINGPDV